MHDANTFSNAAHQLTFEFKNKSALNKQETDHKAPQIIQVEEVELATPEAKKHSRNGVTDLAEPKTQKVAVAGVQAPQRKKAPDVPKLGTSLGLALR